MILPRKLNIIKLLHEKSHFLFGPRSTGKTTLIEHQLADAIVYDLLDSQTYADLLRRPSIIEERLRDPEKIIVIDEVQKLPGLLDEVHRLIHKRKCRFLLTGSSARKLKRGGANLLAGRAWTAYLYPLTSREIPEFDLIRYLNCGGLPHVLPSDSFARELKEYVSNYLREEIQAEAATRNTQAFAEFLDMMALSNGKEINYESLANDCQVSPFTMKNYIQILSDTMIGFSLPGFMKTKKRKAISRAKHYLFDIGVVNSLAQRGSIASKSELFGNAFEHFILLELRACLSYQRKDHQLCYWRSTSQFEVDFVIGNAVAVEVKATEMATERHTKGLVALKEEGLIRRYLVVTLDAEKRVLSNGCEVYPWRDFLDELWGGKLLGNAS